MVRSGDGLQNASSATDDLHVPPPPETPVLRGCHPHLLATSRGSGKFSLVSRASLPWVVPNPSHFPRRGVRMEGPHLACPSARTQQPGSPPVHLAPAHPPPVCQGAGSYEEGMVGKETLTERPLSHQASSLD